MKSRGCCIVLPCDCILPMLVLIMAVWLPGHWDGFEWQKRRERHAL
jgi:hypothetical protein